MQKGKAQALRVLGEDLTLYRGEGGRPYLIGGRCAHRCTVLHTGVIQGDQIRCMYHGWRYDGTGLCTDIPAEQQPRTRPIKIAGYPVHEYCGVVFAYLGEQPVPTFDLPRKHILRRKAVRLWCTNRCGTVTGSSTSKTRSTLCTSASPISGVASGSSDHR